MIGWEREGERPDACAAAYVCDECVGRDGDARVQVACGRCSPEEMLQVETSGGNGAAAEWVGLLKRGCCCCWRRHVFGRDVER